MKMNVFYDRFFVIIKIKATRLPARKQFIENYHQVLNSGLQRYIICHAITYILTYIAENVINIHDKAPKFIFSVNCVH